MTQQVNLYQPILRREKKVFSAATMLQLLALFAVLMLVLFGFTRWQLGELEAENARLAAQEAGLAARVTSLSQELRARPESRELQQALEAARQELALKERLAELMRGRRASAEGGFADAFAGLARQRVEGLWLTGVALRNTTGGARHVTLRGLTANAELVPELVQQLGSEPAFQGVRFRSLKVYQPEDGPRNVLAFELTTEPAETEAGP